MRLAILAAAALLLGACASQQHAPLIFGQTHSLGVSLATNPANQAPELSLGFKDLNIAVVPTVGGLGPDGLIQGRVDGGVDAYSTFGQFQTTVQGSEVGLGKFFATGNAAVALGAGFACKASGYSGRECSGRGPP